MKTVFAFDFRITHSSLQSVIDTIEEYLSHNIEQRINKGIRIDRENAINKTDWSYNGKTVYRFTYTHPDKVNPSLHWVTIFEIRDDGDIYLSVTLNVYSSNESYMSVKLKTGIPRVVGEIIQKYKCDLNGLPLKKAENLYYDKNIKELVELIRNPDREIPVLVISKDMSDNYLIEPKRIVQSIGGICHIAVLNKKELSNDISYELGDNNNCYGGALRLYWPGKLDDHTFLNRYWPWYQISENPEKAIFEIKDVLFENYSLKSGLNTVNKEIISSCEKERSDENLKKLRKEITNETETQVLNMLEAQEREKTELKKENEELKRDNYNKQMQIDSLKNSFQDEKNRYIDAPQAIKSVKDAVDLAARYINNDCLVFLHTAYVSAERSQYKNPVEIFKALMCIYYVATLYHMEVTGFNAHNLFSEYEYRPDISQTANGKYKNDYERTYDGKDIMLGPHIGKGRGSSNDMFRIYWYVDKDRRKYVIGHIGEHLKDDTKD